VRHGASTAALSSKRLGSLAPWRTRMAARRSRTQWKLLVVVTAVAVTACTLITTLGVLVTSTEDGAVRGALTSASADSTVVSVTIRQPHDTVSETADVVAGVIESTLGGALLQTPVTSAITHMAVIPRTGQLYGLGYFGEFDQIAGNATLIDGQWPTLAPITEPEPETEPETEPGAEPDAEQGAPTSDEGTKDATRALPPLEVAIPLSAATALELAVGDSLQLAPGVGRTSETVVIVGIFEPLKPGTLYWSSDWLDGTGHDPSYPVPGSGGGLATDASGPFIAATGSFDSRGVDVSRLVVRATPDLAETGVADLIPLLDQLNMANNTIPVALGDIGEEVSYNSNLTTILKSVSAALTVTRGTVLVVSLLLLALATVALTHTARMINEARESERNLMRARGADTRQLVSLAAIEATAIAIVAVAASAPLARLLYLHLAQRPEMAAAGMGADPGIALSTWLTAMAVSFLFAVVLIAPVIRPGGTFHEGEQSQSRSAKASGLQRSGIDIAIVAVAGIAYWQLLLYKSPVGDTATLAVDPILAAGPVLVLLAGALMSVRLVPLVARLAEFVAARGRGVVRPLAAWEIGRRSHKVTAAILLLTLAIAIGTFSQSYLATWKQSQLDQASYAFGPPARVQSDRALGSGETLRHPPTNDGNPQPVVRRDAIVGGPEMLDRNFDIEGTEAVLVATTGAARNMLVRDDVSGESASIIADTLAESNPESMGSQLADGVVGISGTVAVESLDELVGVTATIRAILEHSSGLLTTLELGSVPVDGSLNSLSGMIADSELPIAGESLRLVGFQAVLVVNEEEAKDASNGFSASALLITDLTSLSPGENAEAALVETPIDVDREAAWFSSGDSYARSIGVGAFARDGWQIALQFTVPPGMTEGTYSVAHIGWPGAGTIRAIVDQGLADTLRTQAGDMLTLAIGGVTYPISIAAVVPNIPGGGAARSFDPLSIGTANAGPANDTILVDQQMLARSLIQAGVPSAAIDEWWVDVPSGQGAEYTDALASSGEGLTAQSVDVLAASMQEHPLRVANQAAVWLVIAGAAILAAVGFSVHATGTLRSRAVEFAQLRAVGLSRRRIIGAVAVESLLISIFSLAFGVGIGVLLAWLVGPLVGASADGTPPVPEVAVQLPFAEMSLFAGELLIVVFLIMAVTSHAQRRADPASVLRQAEER